MEVATTTTEAHLSAIHQSLLQISATLGRMLTYGCVNATSSPDAVVPAKCSTVGLNPNIGAVEVVDSSQQPGIVSTVNPGLVGAPSSSTMQQFGILKSGKHTPTTCSTGVLDVDTDAKIAKRDAGTLQAGLSVHVPWDPGVCNQLSREELPSELLEQHNSGENISSGSKNSDLCAAWVTGENFLARPSSDFVSFCGDSSGDRVMLSISLPWDPGVFNELGTTVLQSELVKQQTSGQLLITTYPCDEDLVDCVLTHIGGSTLFREQNMDAADDKFREQSFKDMARGHELADTQLTHVGGMSLFRELMLAATQPWCGSAIIPECKEPRHMMKRDAELCQQWDPGKQEAAMKGLFGLRPHAETCVSQCNFCVNRRSKKDAKAMQLAADHFLNKMPSWRKGGFSPRYYLWPHSFIERRGEEAPVQELADSIFARHIASTIEQEQVIVEQLAASPLNKCHVRNIKPFSVQYSQILMNLFLGCWQEASHCLQYEGSNLVHIMPPCCIASAISIQFEALLQLGTDGHLIVDRIFNTYGVCMGPAVLIYISAHSQHYVPRLPVSCSCYPCVQIFRGLLTDGFGCYLILLCKCLIYDQLLRPSQLLDQALGTSRYTNFCQLLCWISQLAYKQWDPGGWHHRVVMASQKVSIGDTEQMPYKCRHYCSFSGSGCYVQYKQEIEVFMKAPFMPLLGDKQCFLGAVLSHPVHARYSRLSGHGPWAGGNGLGVWLRQDKKEAEPAGEDIEEENRTPFFRISH